MTTALQVFNHEEFGDTRVVMLDGEPWFVAADVCKALDISNISDAVARLDADELTSIKTMSGGQMREMKAVNEPGLYSLVLSSRKQEAKKFKRWLTHEVIPAIRKTGSYSIESKAYTPVADALADVRKTADEIQNLIDGVKRGIAITSAVASIEQKHDVSLGFVKELLPPAEHETGYLNPTQIGKRLGGIPPRTVNQMLASKGMEYKRGKSWRLTEEGKAYGEEIPYTRNGHSGYQIRWSENVMELFEEEEATA